MNVKSAIEFGDQLFKQVKEQRSQPMIELRRRAAERQGPIPRMRALIGGSVIIERKRRLVTVLQNEISDDDFLIDDDPSLL